MPLTLVLIDDNEDFRSALREVLSMRGHTVLGEAACGASAMEVVGRCAPEMVVLDVQLGVEWGFDLARSLTREHPGLAVVLMSADPSLGDTAHVKACGARAFLPKRQLLTADLCRFR